MLKFRITIRKFSIHKQLINMGDACKKGVPLHDIVAKLEGFAPTKTAEPWDNVGLLIDPMVAKPITKILLTNDLTEPVMQEAINLSVGLIISYHPPIFKALKSLTASAWKERIVINCLKNSIALFSPHTSWDIVEGGVNDWLSKALSPKTTTPITETGCGRLCQLGEGITVRVAVERIKEHLALPHLRLALAVNGSLDSELKSVALCAGAGTSVLAGVKADLLLTGEMLHHEVLDATQNNSNVILTNHSDSERGFLRGFAGVLRTTLLNDDVDVFVSKMDADPLITV